MTTCVSVFRLFSDCHHVSVSGKSVKYAAGCAFPGSPAASQISSPLQSLETLPSLTERTQYGLGVSPHVLDAVASWPREKDICTGSHLVGTPPT